MPTLRHIVLFLHVMAAIFWVGEIFFVGLVVGPYSRTLSPEARRSLFQSVGRRSLPLAWTAIGILLITGAANIALMGIPLGNLFTAAFYRTSFGATLGMKLGFVALMLAVSVVHDFVINRKRRPAQATSGAPSAQGPSHGAPVTSSKYARYRKIASLLGRLNFVLALIVIYLATQLVTGR